MCTQNVVPVVFGLLATAAAIETASSVGARLP